MTRFLFIFILILCSINAYAQSSGGNIRRPLHKNALTKSKNEAQISQKSHEYYNSPKTYIDLGLSVKWATCNLGAAKPEGYGNYYACGELKTKKTYETNNFKPIVHSDVANANWGKPWRLPNKKEIEELINNCIWLWSPRNGVKGYIIKSKKNGNSIFLPAAGNKKKHLNEAGERGCYLGSDSNFGFYSDRINMFGSLPEAGSSVRAVRP